MEDVRWKQRHQNFSNTLKNLNKAAELPTPDIFQRAGLIQFFEITYELAWKMMKDYLKDQGFSEVKSPKATIKKAFEIDIIKDGHIWMEMLDDRNLTTHTYDEESAEKVSRLIKEKYLHLFNDLSAKFKELKDE